MKNVYTMVDKWSVFGDVMVTAGSYGEIIHDYDGSDLFLVRVDVTDELQVLGNYYMDELMDDLEERDKGACSEN